MEIQIKKRIISFAIIILTFFVFLLPAKAFDLNVFQKNNEGYFQKIHSDFPVYGNAVKLKDGRVLITGGQKDIEKHTLGGKVKPILEAEIFDPIIKKSKLISRMNYPKIVHDTLPLNDPKQHR